MSILFKKIDHINIVVKDLEKTKNFFVSLGFTIQHEGLLEGKWLDNLTKLKNVKAEYVALSLNDGETNLELLKFNNPENLSTCDNDVINKTGFRHMAFEVEKIEDVVDALKKDNIEFFSEIQTYPETNKKLCYMRGPEGIMLELAEYKK
ncbi:MAG TPA: VOC family protein [Candidatus Saccharimonadales bacterium]|nr:VOC family protein [Candidatus Saccharimonadales bacterium]